jgi:hypothetical protein
LKFDFTFTARIEQADVIGKLSDDIAQPRILLTFYLCLIVTFIVGNYAFDSIGKG